ncbi:helix-turn-helix domain-containing protein [Sphaerisporangium corydalis]|uniref:Helix-turn-helix transcriptional regulator n=1 Tax=Sphaerisporangium corydalis TaxID=1441875 RepID=A0ABV9EB43_9ACTN|nr:helix-turn-helix transcriptional regulator [Sphaerisporangium corydalis]
MPNPIEINAEESPQARFAYELRQQRQQAGMTQLQLSRRLTVSVSSVGMLETLKRRPDRRFAEACDRVFRLDGVFRELWKQTRWEMAPEHYRDFMALEAQASALQSWDPMLVPGFFQIDSYARRIFEDEPGITPELVEERVAQRIQRQSILSREAAPMIWSIIDEGVLHRPMGDADLMHDQLERLIEVAGHPRVTIQIIPHAARSAVGLQAAFTIAELRGVPYSVYIESAPRGLTMGDRETIAAMVGRYDALRAAALPQNLSLGIIKEMVGKWT